MPIKRFLKTTCRKMLRFLMSTTRCWFGWGRTSVGNNLSVKDAACGKSAGSTNYSKEHISYYKSISLICDKMVIE
jgi:hypothetical protein